MCKKTYHDELSLQLHWDIKHEKPQKINDIIEKVEYDEEE